ncbi:mas-related G-protein coupled receptor member B2-like [Apodemus sylvaticus]|uniref:mas-related G-protein coupled receptor member B2-like n=1 Tax=Apodemus sylvaticus TaxID=10129 RepID=UPI002242C4AC|nr:mas-related G-protein coupled receptor member B2-like [Apodemus sylvaticus]XP_052018085.1 mas-related G-protein coupled receptor member B2-like [Apodemus sylvaticus]
MSGDFLSKNLSISALKTNITMLNGSYYTDSSYCKVKIQAISVLSIIISLLGMGLNAKVMWLLGIRMHRNAFSVYIFNLAMADFLFLCSQFVFSLLFAIYFLYSIFLEIPLVFYVLRIFFYLSGLSILSTISIERCLSVIWPIWYHCNRSKRTSAITCFVLWAMSLLSGLLEGMACGLLFNSFDIYWCLASDVITSVWLIASFVVLIGSNLTLLVRIFCGSQRIPVTRLYVTIAFTVLVFLIFGLPFEVYWLLYLWVGDLHYINNCDVFYDTQFLSCVNSCTNPIIYFLVGSIRRRRFRRKTLKLLLQRAMQDIPEEEECVDNNALEHPEELERVQSSS